MNLLSNDESNKLRTCSCVCAMNSSVWLIILRNLWHFVCYTISMKHVLIIHFRVCVPCISITFPQLFTFVYPFQCFPWTRFQFFFSVSFSLVVQQFMAHVCTHYNTKYLYELSPAICAISRVRFDFIEKHQHLKATTMKHHWHVFTLLQHVRFTWHLHRIKYVPAAHIPHIS